MVCNVIEEEKLTETGDNRESYIYKEEISSGLSIYNIYISFVCVCGVVVIPFSLLHRGERGEDGVLRPLDRVLL